MLDAEKNQPRRTQEERRKQAEEALLNAAIELIAEQGVQQTSFIHIGKRAGYSRGLASHYFGSKEELVSAITLYLQDKFNSQLGDIEGVNGLDMLNRSIDSYFEYTFGTSKDARAYLVLWSAGLQENSDKRPFLEADKRTCARISAVIEIGKNDGSIPQSLDSAAFSEICLALMRGVAIQILTSSFTIDLQDVKKQCRALIGNAIV